MSDKTKRMTLFPKPEYNSHQWCRKEGVEHKWFQTQSKHRQKFQLGVRFFHLHLHRRLLNEAVLWNTQNVLPMKITLGIFFSFSLLNRLWNEFMSVRIWLMLTFFNEPFAIFNEIQNILHLTQRNQVKSNGQKCSCTNEKCHSIFDHCIRFKHHICRRWCQKELSKAAKNQPIYRIEWTLISIGFWWMDANEFIGLLNEFE